MATPVPNKRPTSVTKPALQSRPETAKKLPFQQADARYDSFPIISEFSRADMQRTRELMEESAMLSEQQSEIEAILKSNRAELAEIAKRNEVPGGMRWGNFVVYVSVGQTRRSFKVERAAEYMSLEDIERCYELSKPTDVVKVVDLGKPKGKSNSEANS